jgi:TatA/E family protein of Tat protein translocase
MPFINGIGPGEIIIILIIALIVVGPGKLPDVGSALGKSIREFRKAATDVKESTSLDATPAPPAPAATTPAPGPSATPVQPAATATPPAPVAANPAAQVAAAATAPLVADAAGPAVVPAPDPAAPPAATPSDGTPVADASAEWPAELTPADEHQPTPSA